MKRLHWWLPVVMCLFTLGCTQTAEMEILTARATLGDNREAAPGSSAPAKFSAGLRAAHAEAFTNPIAGSSGVVGAAPGGDSATLTNELASSPLIKKMILNSEWAINAQAPGTENAGAALQKITGDDVKNFVTKVIPKLGVGTNLAPGSMSEQGQRATKVLRRIQRYWVPYSQGKFVDRYGRTVAAPSVSAKGVNNSTITGILTIVLEATYDEFFHIPVYVSPKTGENKPKDDADPLENPNQFDWLTPNGEVPTAAVLKECPVSKVDGTWTEEKIRAISFFATVAGEQSKLVSGLVFRLFSDVHISFVVGGEFAVGDNDTLALALDTFFDISSRRTTEASTYAFFLNNPNVTDEWLKDLIGVLKQAYDQMKQFEEKKNKKG